MLKQLKTALGIEAPTVTALPTTALIPVPIHRAAPPVQGGDSMGYMDRNHDSARPQLNMQPALRTANKANHHVLLGVRATRK